MSGATKIRGPMKLNDSTIGLLSIEKLVALFNDSIRR